MPDLLATGGSALLAFQRQLATTSHNIANANTEGYSRQRVNFSPRYGQYYGFGYVGGGVQAIGVDRTVDQFLGNRLVDSASQVGRLNPLANFTSRLDRVFSDTATGLGGTIDGFFSSIEGVASTPSSGAARQEMLARGNILAGRFQSLARQIESQGDELRTRISGTVTAINDDADALAKLNEQIAMQQAATGQPPNDLLDQRDVVLRRLAGHIGVSTLAQPDGTLNVFTANGQALVLNTTSMHLSLANDAYDPSRLTLALDTPSGKTPLSEIDVGGELGGLLDYRRDVLDPAAANLGRLAISLARGVNTQHRLGMDATGAMGGDFFTEAAPVVRSANGNTGTGTVGATIANPSQLTGTNYELRYNGGVWTAFDHGTGAALTMTGAGTVASPFVIDGVEFVVGGTPANGDSFLVEPLALAASSLNVAITNPDRIASADPLRGAALVSNLGDGSIGRVTVTNPADPNLFTPVSIQFTSATTYSINGSGSFPYTPGGPITVNGWSMAIQGSPLTGDTFTIGPRGAASSDNGNARDLAALARANLVGGTSTISAGNAALVGSIGGTARSVALSLDAETAVDTQLQAQRESTSGVNLDEEAANMMKFQQSYSAAAQIIAVADTIFQTLLGAVRR